MKQKQTPRLIIALVAAAVGTGCATTRNGDKAALHASSVDLARCQKNHDRCRANLETAQARIANLESATMANTEAMEFLQRRLAAYKEIALTLAAAFEPGQFKVRIREGMMIVQLPNDILFELGRADLNDDGRKILRQVASVMRNSPDRRFLIAGHTDNIPVSEKAREYHSNWELSALRALSVVEFLTDEEKVKPTQVAIAGYGEYQPEVSNDTPEDRAKNRRTEVVVVPLASEIPEIPAEDVREVESVSMVQTAQVEPTEAEPEPEPEPMPMTPPPSREALFPVIPRGFSLIAGGGVTDFTENDVRDFVDVGGMWGARLVYGTDSLIAFEGAYLGGAQNIDAIGLDNDAVLLSTTLEANARVNIIPTGIWQPYAFVGAGWRRYDIVNSDTNTSSIEDEDNVFEVPLGAGLSFRYDMFTADVRGVFRAAFGSDMVDASVPSDSDGRLHNYGFMAMAGFRL